jgi:hypothetical protein
MATYPYSADDVNDAFFADAILRDARREHITPHELITQTTPEESIRLDFLATFDRGLAVLQFAELEFGELQKGRDITMAATIAPVVLSVYGWSESEDEYRQMTLRKRDKPLLI